MNGLELRRASEHNVIMEKDGLFTFKIEPDPLGARRFRWTVCEGNQIHLRSPHSYATRREAEEEADKAMRKFSVMWSENK